MNDFLRENGYFDFGEKNILKNIFYCYSDSSLHFFGSSDDFLVHNSCVEKHNPLTNRSDSFYIVNEFSTNNYPTILVNSKPMDTIREFAPKQYLLTILNSDEEKLQKSLHKLFFQVFEIFQLTYKENFSKYIHNYLQNFHEYKDLHNYSTTLINNGGDGYSEVFVDDLKELLSKKENLLNRILVSLEKFVYNSYFVGENSFIKDLSIIGERKSCRFVSPFQLSYGKQDNPYNLFVRSEFLPILENELMELV